MSGLEKRMIRRYTLILLAMGLVFTGGTMLVSTGVWKGAVGKTLEQLHDEDLRLASSVVSLTEDCEELESEYKESCRTQGKQNMMISANLQLLLEAQGIPPIRFEDIP